MALFASIMLRLKNGKVAELRSARPEDAPLFSAFQKQISRETHFTMQREDLTPTLEQMQERWKRESNDPVSLRLCAFCDGKIVGVLGAHSVWPGHPWTLHVLEFGMMLLKDFWGSGLSDEMMKALFSHAKKINVTRIEALVRAQNLRGVSFYKKMGFTIEGTRKRAAIIDGVEHDEFYIAKLDEGSKGV